MPRDWALEQLWLFWVAPIAGAATLAMRMKRAYVTDERSRLERQEQARRRENIETPSPSS